MDIGFTEEQELLRNTARKFLDSECDTECAKASEIALGDATWHRERIARLLGA